MAFIRSNLRNIIIACAVIIGAFFGYSYFFGGDQNNGAALSVSTPSPESTVGRDLLIILANLQTLRLDDSVFRNPAFQALKNFRVELSPEPVGRENPFAPLSGSSVSGSNIKIRSFNSN